MKLIKIYTRQATLLERDLICQSLMQGLNSLPEVFYTYVANVSVNGIVDIYAEISDIQRNKTSVLQLAQQDKGYVHQRMQDGLKANRALGNLPADLPQKIKELSPSEIKEELLILKEKLAAFSGFFDFTHILGETGITLDGPSVLQLSEFHEIRKETFARYFLFLKDVCEAVAQRMNIPGNFSSLLFTEIMDVIDGKVTAEEVKQREVEREKHILIVTPKKTALIKPVQFEEERQKIESQLSDSTATQIKGLGVYSGIARGRVKKIDLRNRVDALPPGTVIVAAVTQPEMTVFLKNAVAIVTDEGGLLCHAANVAREFGIPTVVGTKNATQVLKDGDTVEVNSKEGTVRKIE